MQPQKIYLLRHGEIAIPTNPEEKFFVGRKEFPLTDRGRLQIKNAGLWLQQREGKRCPASQHKTMPIWSSPLVRCRESAAIIGKILHREIAVKEALTEISLGAWEGLSKAAVQQRFPVEYRQRGEDFTFFRPPPGELAQGESFFDVQQRVLPAMKEITENAENTIIIVAHAGVNRVVLASILGLPLDNIFRFAQNYGAVNIISQEKGRYTVETVNALP